MGKFKRPTPPPNKIVREYHEARDDIHSLNNAIQKYSGKLQLSKIILDRMIEKGFEKSIPEEFIKEFESLKKHLAELK